MASHLPAAVLSSPIQNRVFEHPPCSVPRWRLRPPRISSLLVGPVPRYRGQWTKHKYQNLFDLVKLDLQVKAYQNYDAGNRQFRYNIVWEDISEKLTTRNRKNCCIK
ncbi:uncharacterized protein [Oryza sativa Japonica Group]|nr:uncharacterized protein LOC4338074 isoform X2 [Oryza sativa Japonica Group]XP_015638181.1 uncharacterized protein LOC4338074 isoform X3 [Oryza sativa Japonica Group]XP_015638182.1 uncharacterized protein LOC4338074 isoform X4 [Oryza sativa Japonica Group]KAF2929620.1 hypothetical protein DAI22_05g069800 [Oryza sativa Japonica Group]KAF2929622.1 hypothetical protein DAI22_05g069800 [Oryza sativa Japonica Group]